MQRAKILKNYKGKIKEFEPKELQEIQKEQAKLKELLFFKHSCSNKWLKRVIKRAKLKDKLNPDDARRVLLEAVKLRMEK